MSENVFDQNLPPGRTRVDRQSFRFHCHYGLSCFLSCCRDVDMLLFPYDIVQLKKYLQLSSSEFLYNYTTLCAGSHAYFPGLKLKLLKDNNKSCPFLGVEGCVVYENRPSACRTYPLERGVEQLGVGEKLRIHYYMTHHLYCKGHHEERSYSIRQWERDQMLYEYNMYNDLWAELDAFFSTNPWSGEGEAGPYQQLAFMVCYNIDGFRGYIENNDILNGFKLKKDERNRIANDDGQLLQFGFKWLEYILGGRKNIVRK